jgi:hypothetical protein
VWTRVNCGDLCCTIRVLSVFLPCSLLSSIELTLFVIQMVRLPFVDVILS